jgi:hypothetical protein
MPNVVEIDWDPVDVFFGGSNWNSDTRSSEILNELSKPSLVEVHDHN